METYLDAAKSCAEAIRNLPLHEKIAALNEVRRLLHDVSPFRNEPVDYVEWVPAEDVNPNDYNPNIVAPPEKKLLEISVKTDGYTQPIVSFCEEDRIEIVDGFYRSQIGKISVPVRKRTLGYVPITRINSRRRGRSSRIAATIRHNRARGKHGIGTMSAIVIELTRCRWSDKRIADELGMDADEVLRLKQISGLADMFANRNFSKAWDIDEERL